MKKIKTKDQLDTDSRHLLLVATKSNVLKTQKKHIIAFEKRFWTKFSLSV